MQQSYPSSKVHLDNFSPLNASTAPDSHPREMPKTYVWLILIRWSVPTPRPRKDTWSSSTRWLRLWDAVESYRNLLGKPSKLRSISTYPTHLSLYFAQWVIIIVLERVKIPDQMILYEEYSLQQQIWFDFNAQTLVSGLSFCCLFVFVWSYYS